VGADIWSSAERTYLLCILERGNAESLGDQMEVLPDVDVVAPP